MEKSHRYNNEQTLHLKEVSIQLSYEYIHTIVEDTFYAHSLTIISKEKYFPPVRMAHHVLIYIYISICIRIFMFMSLTSTTP